MQPTSEKRLVSTLALAGAALAVGLGLCELAVRAFVRPPVPIRFAELAIATEESGGGGELAGVFERDPERFWRLAPDVRRDARIPGGEAAWIGVVSNARGIRDVREIPLEKPEGEFRLLFLGDSTTFGWRLRHDETVAYLCEQLLRARLPGVAITAINAGVPGYTIFQGWRTFATVGLAYAPDVVVVSFGFNDAVSWGGRSDLAVYEHLAASQPPAVLRWSRLAELVWQVSRRLPPSETARQRVTRDEFGDLLGRIEATARARDIGMVVLIGAVRANIDGAHPDAYRRPLQREQLDWGRAKSPGPGSVRAVVDAVPIVQRLARDHGVDAVLLDRVHPTVRTNRAVASALADQLTPWLQLRSAR